MEQFSLFHVPVHNKNKSLNAQSVTKQELSKYEADRNPTYQIDSWKKILRSWLPKQTF